MSEKRRVSSTATSGLVPLSQVLDHALEQLRPLPSADDPSDGILFSGNRHESVPRALFLDSRLTPLERNAWQVFRLLLNDDGVTAFPTYDQLRPYLTSMPCSGKASDETVARALTLLRLTRWLTLARHRRDATTGRLQGNLYVLHDEPLTPYEAIQLDPHYLELVSHALTHASKAIQRVGYFVLKEATDDPLLSGRVFPSRLQGLLKRLASQGWASTIGTDLTQDDVAPDGHGNPLPADQEQDLRASGKRPSTSESKVGPSRSSDSEVRAKSLNQGCLRIPKQDSTVRTVHTELLNQEVRTVPRARECPRLQLPQRFVLLRAKLQAGALAALQQVEFDLQQPVLDEWDARCKASSVRNPAGYLFGIIQKAMRGEFHASASKRTADRSAPPEFATTPAQASTDASARRDLAQQHIAKLRAMMKIR